MGVAPITELMEIHRMIYDNIVESHRPSMLSIHQDLKANIKSVQYRLNQLLQIGLIEKVPVKSKLRCYYIVTDMTFEEAEEKFREKFEPIPDPILDACKTFELSDDQWNYIRANPTLGRREIAKKFGVHRTVLLAAIDKRKRQGSVVKSLNFQNANNSELKTVIFDEECATEQEKNVALDEAERRRKSK